MAHVAIQDFRGGLDRRKSILTGEPGTLYVGKNVHVTRGGEIEQRKAFAPFVELPDATKGLTSNNASLFTFGPAAAATVLPAPLIYISIDHPDVQPKLLRIVDSTNFRGLPYVLAAYDDGSVMHFYNGTIVPAFAPGGSLETFKATGCVTLGSKVYITANSSLIFCENDAPLVFGTNINGSGAIDMSTKYSGSETLTAVNIYISKLAIYSNSTVQIWIMDPDPLKNSQLQVMPNLGTLASGSIVPYGDSDNFVLAQTGIRSLRARDLSNTAGIYDIGTPIDDLVNPLVKSLDADTVARSQGVLEPVDGRFLLSIGSSVFVFSYFSTAKISAWSEYILPGPVNAWGVVGRRLYARIGNTVTLYGGASEDEYDASPYELVLPMVDAKAPGTEKDFHAVDVAATGNWDLEVGMNAGQPNVRELIARIFQPTFGMQQYPAVGKGTHFGIRLSGSSVGPNTLSSVIVHHAPFDDRGG